MSTASLNQAATAPAAPSQANALLHARRIDATPRGVAVGGNFFAQRALNSEIWDVEGNRYIDFAAGIAVLNTGHCHPRIVAAVSEQLQRFTHTCYQVVPYESYVTLAENISRATPGTFKKKTALFTTGVEAVENAVKIARSATGRSGVIAFTGAFHGRSLMGMALTGKVAPYKEGFGAMPGEVFHALFPNALYGVSIADALRSLEHLFKFEIAPDRCAAIIIEPVQGEGGFNMAPPELMQAIRALCDRHGIVMIVDEIQTGFGRTGKLFACEHYDVVPDLITMAKSLAGGMPLSAVCGRADMMEKAVPGGLGGTYAGNALATAAANAVMQIIEDEKLCERANVLGGRLKACLDTLRAEVPEIVDVRGVGAMVAVEFFRTGTQQPYPEFVGKVQKLALESGLILLSCGIYGNAIRFLHPLTIQDNVFDEALAILRKALLQAHLEMDAGPRADAALPPLPQ